MKIMLIVFAVLLTAGVIYGFKNYVSPKRISAIIQSTPKNFHELSYTDINGSKVEMSQYRGKYVLCVNVASKCGNTKQYEALQKLYTKYADKLVIIGFPCNQFMGQEPGTEKDIAEFCTKNYGVTFPLSSKLDVKGNEIHPVYSWLTMKDLNGVADDKIEWNFHKVLISPEGKWLKAFSASMDPGNGEIAAMLK